MSQSQSQLPGDSAGDSLYCGEVVTWDADAWISDHTPSSAAPPPYPPPLDENIINRFIDSESHHMPHPDYLQRYRDRSIDVTARQDTINWILKVRAHYGFSPVTALLSVNYLDRLLSSHPFPNAKEWPFQLLSVACLSLAAKMEEPEMPLLLDLQVIEPAKYIFEPNTIKRMELWVMSHLSWRLRSVTPFDYLDYFISKLPSSSSPQRETFTRVLAASSDLILSTTRVIDFLGFAPSTIAAAAVLCIAGGTFDMVGGDGEFSEYFHERVNKEMVRSCHQLMEEYLVDTCPAARHKDRSIPPPAAPSSPVGVLDAAACGSCDTRSENPGSSSHQAEPPAKRHRSSTPDVQQP